MTHEPSITVNLPTGRTIEVEAGRDGSVGIKVKPEEWYGGHVSIPWWAWKTILAFTQSRGGDHREGNS